MRAALGNLHVPAVIDGEEYMGSVCEVWKGGLERQGIVGVRQHEGHRGPEEHDLGLWKLGELLSFEVPETNTR